MGAVSEAVDIAAPPERVWEVITSTARTPEWQPQHTGYGAGTPETLSAGASFRQQIRIMGMPGEVLWTVSVFEAPSRLALDGQGPMGTFLKSRFDIAASDGGSRVEFTNEVGGAALAALGPAFEGESRRLVHESLGQLQALLG